MYLITGATGHVGNTLIRHLLAVDSACKIRAFVLPNSNLASLEGLDVEIFYGNVLNPDDIAQAMEGIEIVFHLAGIIAISDRNSEMVEKVNIQGSINVAKSALQANVRRMIHVASIHIFERVPAGVIDERIPLVTRENAAGIYDYTKAEAVRQLRDITKQGLDIVFACPTGIFGPNDYLGSEFGKTIRSYLEGTKHSTAKGGYDWVDVRDVAKGLTALIDKGETGELHLLGGNYASTEDLILTIGKILNKSYEISVVPYPALRVMASVMSMLSKLFNTQPSLTVYSLRTLRDNANISHQKASNVLGYRSRPFEETLRDTIAWYQAHPLD